ncbi:MAG: hypothetical protein ACKVQA_09130 [Burkholderiales bacterium]
MKLRSSVAILLAGASLFAQPVFAEGITSRNAGDAYNDMMRNYGAPANGEVKRRVMVRSEEAGYADMNRDWNAKMTGQPQKELHSLSEKERYAELMRGTFPLSPLSQ